MDHDQIIYTEKPSLDQPYLILGFEGWPNAAEVSSFALTQLIESTKARKFASLPYENFYQISSSRLVGVVKEGKLTELKFPGNHFYYLKNSPSIDAILFYGIEPHFQWSAFASGRRQKAGRTLSTSGEVPFLLERDDRRTEKGREGGLYRGIP
jgi:proteasome assembly chaperone (PAC2) family protein